MLVRSLLAAAIVGALTTSSVAKPVVEMELAVMGGQGPEFPKLPAAADDDAGNAATITLIDGRRDPNGAGVGVLNDGELASAADAPQSNFFLSPEVDGGRLLITLDEPRDVKSVRTYSRHPGGRGPQRYALYVRDSVDEAAQDELATDPADENSGWKLLTEVDTRKLGTSPNGTAVAIKSGAREASLGRHRYLLMAIEKVEPDDMFGQTFYSEIDIDDGQQHDPPPGRSTLEIEGGYAIEFDTTQTPQLTPWVDKVLKPICAEWYPKIVTMFPSEGYEAPRRFTITFRAGMRGVAYTAGTSVVCAGPWFEGNLEGEAAGAVVHELVHVVQQFRRGRARTPSWVVEGLADYLRWFCYEPQEKRPRVNFDRANFDDSYRTTGAFFDYLARTHGAEIMTKLNDRARRGEYTEQTWEDLTGKSVEDLWLEYVQSERQQN